MQAVPRTIIIRLLQIPLNHLHKAFRRVAMERRLPLTIKRTDVVGCALRAFAQMNGPSLFRTTEVKFIGEAGVDRGGLMSEMLADFFGALVPATSTSASEPGTPVEWPEVPEHARSAQAAEVGVSGATSVANPAGVSSPTLFVAFPA